ncbi:MAG: hypothetical protein UHL07_05215 [Bacteroidaceae bacterium]|nr:hypothetical protein [Bacteroidaceae bacterium]
MKKTYMQPSAEVMNISGKDAVMEPVLSVSNSEVNTVSDQLSRDEEMFWDEEQGW